MITHFVEFCRERIFFKILCNHSAPRIFAKLHDTHAFSILQTESYTALHKIRSLQEAHRVYPAR